MHLVADIHQPLHVGNTRDRGGNRRFVRYFGERTNLHAVWDVGLIDRLQLSYTGDRALSAASDERGGGPIMGTRELCGLDHRIAGLPGASLSDQEASSGRRSRPPRLCGRKRAGDRGRGEAEPGSLRATTTGSDPLLDRRLAQAGVRLALTLDRIFSLRDPQR